ncbi:nucleotide-binding domain-containing protein [Psychrobacter urativorans]
MDFEEATLYPGLHTMKCEVYDKNGLLLFRDWIGVMIK